MQMTNKELISMAREPDAWREFDGEGGYYYRSYEHNEDYCSNWDTNNPNHKGWVEPLYTTPPQRPWIGLTDAEAQWIYDNSPSSRAGMMDMVEAKLKEKNT